MPGKGVWTNPGVTKEAIEIISEFSTCIERYAYCYTGSSVNGRTRGVDIRRGAIRSRKMW